MNKSFFGQTDKLFKILPVGGWISNQWLDFTPVGGWISNQWLDFKPVV